MNDRPYCVTGAFLDESAHEGELLVDGARYRVTEADYRSLGFAEGDFLDESALEAVCTAAERLRCIRKAMDCLSYGDMSGKKLLGKLTGRFDRELASSVVELLRARGYLDDAALSARLAESFYDNKLWGPLRIRSELSARGFSPEDVAAALKTAGFSRVSVSGRKKRTLAERKFGRLSFDDYAQKSKAFAYLYRCGYESADITDTISKMEQEEREWL